MSQAIQNQVEAEPHIPAVRVSTGSAERPEPGNSGARSQHLPLGCVGAGRSDDSKRARQLRLLERLGAVLEWPGSAAAGASVPRCCPRQRSNRSVADTQGKLRTTLRKSASSEAKHRWHNWCELLSTSYLRHYKETRE